MHFYRDGVMHLKDLIRIQLLVRKLLLGNGIYIVWIVVPSLPAHKAENYGHLQDSFYIFGNEIL